MCWCFPFGLATQKKRTSTSSGERKRREKPAAESLHGNGVPVVAEVQEKRRSKEAPQKRRSKETVTTRSPRREREAHRPRQDYQYQDAYRSREQYRPALNVQVPNMWQRDVEPQSSNSSQEMLLNPRPHRSPHTRQSHPKRTSQTTLRATSIRRYLKPHLPLLSATTVHVSTSDNQHPPLAKHDRELRTQPLVAHLTDASQSAPPQTELSRTYGEKHLRSPLRPQDANACNATRVSRSQRRLSRSIGTV
ncbi:hypothetical protein BDV96DRAFT_501037 [Lophiotrema nucula]|uniref:Uncharacterized protein n=1 Tax=Lophiotrema nucula TaxID=690887 RepID=A0A6A5YT30_9PLEO|nr:hypothetical protein BDV96DRAFT_501037 [Lophiotrema nucula]